MQRETRVPPLLPERLVYGGVVATELYSSTGKARGEASKEIASPLPLRNAIWKGPWGRREQPGAPASQREQGARPGGRTAPRPRFIPGLM